MSKKEAIKQWCKDHEGLIIGVSVGTAMITGIAIGQNTRTFKIQDYHKQVGKIGNVPVYLAQASDLQKASAVDSAMVELGMTRSAAGVLRAVKGGTLNLDSMRDDLILQGYDPKTIGVCLLGEKLNK